MVSNAVLFVLSLYKYYVSFVSKIDGNTTFPYMKNEERVKFNTVLYSFAASTYKLPKIYFVSFYLKMEKHLG